MSLATDHGRRRGFESGGTQQDSRAERAKKKLYPHFSKCGGMGGSLWVGGLGSGTPAPPLKSGPDSHHPPDCTRHFADSLIRKVLQIYYILGHLFQGQKVKVQGHQAALLTAAFTYQAPAAASVGTYSPWEYTATLQSGAVGSAARGALVPTEGGEGRKMS